MPAFTQALIIANVIVYLLEMQMGGVLFQWFALWPGAGRGLASLPLLTPWQLITYSFLHGGLTHLAFNMFALWMFGGELERVWGVRRVAMATLPASSAVARHSCWSAACLVLPEVPLSVPPQGSSGFCWPMRWSFRIGGSCH